METQSLGVVRELWPLVLVQDIERSIAFYRDRLGFTVVGEAKTSDRVFWCRLKRGGASIMLQQAEEVDGPPVGRGRGVGFYFICDDADGLYAEWTGRGLTLAPPTIADYGMKQLFVPEPDGYSICFESPTDGT
jgi:catechol 2,3-dioxygenase-like lactoylglutathione lyase family enzyme